MSGYSKSQFNLLYQEFLEHEADLLNIKREEYTDSGEDDCLQNFRDVAAFEGRSPEAVCMTYILKHIQSIQRAVNSGNADAEWWKGDVEGLKQRIADARNFLVLLAAILDDKNGGSE